MPSNPIIDARDVEGVQHCHGDNCDAYYYRPLVYGNDLFTYIAHIPPGGGVPPDQEEADLFEMSLYVLSGHPQVTYANERFEMRPHTALHCEKGVPVGFRNDGPEPVSLILSFSPPPQHAGNPEEMRRLVESRGRSVFSPESMNRMAGDLLA
jgi:mannose-6-phosphate isomerase-like protein (cupin superfamily)